MTKLLKLETDRIYKRSAKEEKTIVNRIALGMEGIQIAWKEEKSFRNQVSGSILMVGTLLIVNPPDHMVGFCRYLLPLCFFFGAYQYSHRIHARFSTP